MLASQLTRRAAVSLVTRRSIVTCSRAVSAIKVHTDDVPTVSDVSVNVTFVNYQGSRKTFQARVGDSLLEVAQKNDYEFLDGACDGGGSVYAVKHDELWTEDQYGEGASCSFCHVIVTPDMAAKIPDPMRDEALRLDVIGDPETRVEGLSRLGCQVRVTADMDGMVVHCPDAGYSDIP